MIIARILPLNGFVIPGLSVTPWMSGLPRVVPERFLFFGRPSKCRDIFGGCGKGVRAVTILVRYSSILPTTLCSREEPSHSMGTTSKSLRLLRSSSTRRGFGVSTPNPLIPSISTWPGRITAMCVLLQTTTGRYTILRRLPNRSHSHGSV